MDRIECDYRCAECDYRDAEYDYRCAEYEYRDAEYEYRDAEVEGKRYRKTLVNTRKWMRAADRVGSGIEVIGPPLRDRQRSSALPYSYSAQRYSYSKPAWMIAQSFGAAELNGCRPTINSGDHAFRTTRSLGGFSPLIRCFESRCCCVHRIAC